MVSRVRLCGLSDHTAWSDGLIRGCGSRDAQGAEVVGRGFEDVPAVDAQVGVDEGREVGDEVGRVGGALAIAVVEKAVDVAGVPKDDDVEEQAEGAELLLLALAVATAEVSAVAEEEETGEGMSGLAAIELGGETAAEGLVVDVVEEVEGLGDAADLLERAA